MMPPLEDIHHIHSIGICGSGMSAVSILLKELGYRVTGSDENVFPPISTVLHKNDIPITTTYSKNNIQPSTDLIILGKSKRINEKTNEEVHYALKRGIPITSFPEVLESLTKEKHSLVIAGSAGKTTCTALTTWVLMCAKKDPSFFIGGIPKNIGVNAGAGSGKLFVLEGDEYPTSNDDTSAKFLHYNPKEVLVTSMEHDHFDVFKTKKDFNEPFLLLSRKAKRLCVNITNDNTLPLHDTGSAIETYAVSKDAEWKGENIHFTKDGTEFSLYKRSEKLADIKTSLLGYHSVENIVGVAILLIGGGHVTVEEFVEGVSTFTGVKNRLEKLNKKGAISIYEGFGSSFEKVRASIEALLPIKKGNLVILFEPFATSWGMREYLPFYKTLFRGADRVYLYTPPLKGKDVSASDIISISENGIIPFTATDTKTLMKTLKSDDILLTLSSSDFDGLRNTLVQLIEERTTV